METDSPVICPFIMNNSARRVALPETSQMIQSKHKLISSLAGFHHIALAPSDSPLALQFAVNMDSIDGTEHYERASDGMYLCSFLICRL